MLDVFWAVAATLVIMVIVVMPPTSIAQERRRAPPGLFLPQQARNATYEGCVPSEAACGCEAGTVVCKTSLMPMSVCVVREKCLSEMECEYCDEERARDERGVCGRNCAGGCPITCTCDMKTHRCVSKSGSFPPLFPDDDRDWRRSWREEHPTSSAADQPPWTSATKPPDGSSEEVTEAPDEQVTEGDDGGLEIYEGDGA
ncbi:unnamed protein product [Vitrella brassicaformis CCMP3155]|uniref:Uncharacterized protein n=2 Tax=Vitrella brassicaformis TaxID=1169539 RepID=A0A0G4GVR7_VITBC|nr:unnamed protein product [Vitrella brassicaformis CCMP3155]|eukprot:CEM35054.1 unnamed protein product [Vitrella brassicaformis CCMP3155]